MSFELGSAFNGGAEWLCASPVAFGALRNPVVVALLITALSLVAVYAAFGDRLRGAGWRPGVKAGFWMAMGAAALVFAHYYALGRHLDKNNANQGVRDVVASVGYSVAAGGGYEVRPADEGAPGAPEAPLPPAAFAPRPDNLAAGGPPLELSEVVFASAPSAAPPPAL